MTFNPQVPVSEKFIQLSLGRAIVEYGRLTDELEVLPRWRVIRRASVLRRQRELVGVIATLAVTLVSD